MIAPENAVLRERTSPIIVIFCIGLMAEFILPWAVIWLSDKFSLISCGFQRIAATCYDLIPARLPI
jgi:hypothetical protein